MKEIYQRSKFSRNTAPKILSIVFALIFWIFVMDTVNPEMTRVFDNIPIEIVGESQLEANGYRIMGNRNFVMSLTLKGRRNDVIKLTKDDLEVIADLGNVSNGLKEIPLDPRVQLNEVSIINQSRESILLKIDAMIRKPVPVSVVKEGELPPNYVEDDIRLSIEQIFINGPESYVNLVDKMIGTINLNNATSELVRDLPVIPVDSNGETVTGVEVETDYITVSIGISKRSDILVQPKYEGSVADGYQLTEVTVEPQSVALRGDRDTINALKYVETEVVDLSNASESFSIELPINKPDNLNLENNNQRITINFTIEPIITKEFSFDYSDITFINMEDPYRTNINDLEGQVILRVSAVESIVSPLNKNDLGLYINAGQFVPGKVEAEIQLNRNYDFNKVEILPNIVEIIVTDINAPLSEPEEEIPDSSGE
jgi:YbbR domain-containing protein